MSFLHKLKDNFASFMSSPVTLMKLIYQKFIRIKNSFFSFFYHFKILREANISLGKYHLQKGNFKDASLRFRITNKFFAPNDPENNYWHAWAHIFLKEYREAIEKLSDNSFDKIGLGNFVTNMSTVWTIPEEIEREYNFLSQHFKTKRYFTDKQDAFAEFLSTIISYIPQNNWDKTMGKYTVLEISTLPFLIEELVEYLPEPYLIDGINFHTDRTKEAKNYTEKNKIYHELITSKREDFAKELSIKYEAILAFDSLSYTAILKENFRMIKSLLTDDGFFACLLPKGLNTKLEPNNCHFIFTQKYIEDQLKLAEFESKSITTITISKNIEYYMVIAK